MSPKQSVLGGKLNRPMLVHLSTLRSTKIVALHMERRPLSYLEFINVTLTTRAKLVEISGDQSEEPSLLMKSVAS